MRPAGENGVVRFEPMVGGKAGGTPALPGGGEEYEKDIGDGGGAAGLAAGAEDYYPTVMTRAVLMGSLAYSTG